MVLFLSAPYSYFFYYGQKNNRKTNSTTETKETIRFFKPKTRTVEWKSKRITLSWSTRQSKIAHIMKVSEKNDEFNEASSTLSSLIRGVNYSFFAIVWIFSNENLNNINQFSWILLFSVSSLIFDILQYLWKTIATWFSFRKSEKEDPDDTSTDHSFPCYISTTTWGLFWLKILCCLFSGVILVLKIVDFIHA